MDDFCGNLCMYKIKFISDVPFLYRRDNVPRKTNSAMRFVLLVSKSRFLRVESLLISIKISLSFLKELPYCNKLTHIEAPWYKGLCSLESPISQIAIT